LQESYKGWSKQRWVDVEGKNKGTVWAKGFASVHVAVSSKVGGDWELSLDGNNWYGFAHCWVDRDTALKESLRLTQACLTAALIEVNKSMKELE
jgi:hypothetical protein